MLYLLVKSVVAFSLGIEEECENSLRIIQRTSKSPSCSVQEKRKSIAVETFDDVPENNDEEEKEEED